MCGGGVLGTRVFHLIIPSPLWRAVIITPVSHVRKLMLGITRNMIPSFKNLTVELIRKNEKINRY